MTRQGSPINQSALVALCSVLSILFFLLLVYNFLGLAFFYVAAAALPFIFLAIRGLESPIHFITAGLLWYGFGSLLVAPVYFPYIAYNLYNLNRFIDELIILPLFVIVLMYISQRKPFNLQRLPWLFLVIIFWTVLSGIYNSSGKVKIILFIEVYFRHYLVFLVTALYFRGVDTTYRKIGLFFIRFLFLQLALNIAWFLGINPIPNGQSYPGGWGADMFIGSIGYGDYIVYLASIFMNLTMVPLLTRGSDFRTKLQWGFLAFISIVIFGLGHTKHAIPICGLGSIVVALLLTRKQVFKRIAMMAFAVFLGFSFFYFNEYSGKKMNPLYLGISLNTEGFQTYTAIKQETYGFVNQELCKNPIAFLLGKGPGNFTSQIAEWKKPALYLRYFYKDAEPMVYNRGGTVMNYQRTGVTDLLGEIGYGGAGMYFFIVILCFRRIWRLLRNGHYEASPWAKRFAYAWFGYAVFFLLLSVLRFKLHTSLVPYIFWAYTGMMWNPVITKKMKKDLNEPE